MLYCSWLKHFNCPMQDGAIGLVICVESFRIWEDLEFEHMGEWIDFLGSIGFMYVPRDSVTMILYAEDENLEREVNDAFSFEWTSRLVAPDYAAIYDHIYYYFAKNPQRMKELHWREFEQLLASIFIEQGYKTKLNKGRDDEGVDLRLIESSIYGDQVTVVQVKKYKNPIKLEQVAALSGVTHDQHAKRGIFVTTSRYLPSAHKFAARQERKIDLLTSADVALWCDAISSQKPAPKQLNTTILKSDLDPKRVVYAHTGYTMTMYDFAYIVAESPTAVRLAKLPEILLPQYGFSKGEYGYPKGRRFDTGAGHVIPDLSRGLGPETVVFTARRHTKSRNEES